MRILTLSIVFILSFSTYAQEVDAFKEDIKELMIMTGSDKLSLQMMDQLLFQFESTFPDVPSEVWVEFRNEVKIEELMDLIIPVYQKHFTHDDIKSLIEFYKTPLGKKTIAVMPSVVQESMVIGQQWGLEIAERAQKKLEEKGY